MTIQISIAKVRALLDRVAQYEHIVLDNNFEHDTITDMKGNARSICDEIRSDVNDIKNEINKWS